MFTGRKASTLLDFPQDQDFHIWLEHNLDDRGHSPAERLLLTNQQEMVGLAISQKTNKDGVHRNLGPGPRCDYTSKRHEIAADIQIILSSISIILCLLELLAIVPPFRKEENRTRATTYNLYLVFLAIPDLTYNMFLVILFATYNDYMSDPEDTKDTKCETETERESNLFPMNYHEFDIALFASCAFVTLYMNALIFYEILKLLRNSKRRQRCNAPTFGKACLQALLIYVLGVVVFIVDDKYEETFLKELGDKWWRCNAPTFGKACLQALLIYVLGVVVFIVDYNLEDPIFEENDDKWWRILIYYFIVAVVPISYLIWVPFRVWREGLIKYDSRFGRLTCLLNYFSRIICVYVFFWIPASILFILQYVVKNDGGFFFYLSCNCYAIQVWVSFGFVIMKPDIRRDVLNLLLPAKCQKADQESHSDYSPSIERQTKPLTETEPGLATAERSPSSPSQDSETSWCIGNSTNQWDSMFLSSNAKSDVENQQMRLSDRGDEESENLSPASLIRTAVKDSSCSSSLIESQRNKPSMTDTLDCEHACACLAEESMNNVNYVSKTDRTSRSLNSVADGDDDEEFGSVEGNVVDDYNENDQNIHPDRDTDTDRDNWEGNQSVDGQEAVES
eukprot:CAMPEP_0172409486 /NCGR_PEP_ID=MMETSP1061-20121228/76391_1 /TAXON_ID=37318 /ORGANISM="Pseudo-nitzschia pungens, Strain cf. pungens" /LENGTH=620 /DNA_ID=CAMNT_0013145641 /DNA_START=511 /DNA_END=2374 /DNA_ORIENTATION=-